MVIIKARVRRDGQLAEIPAGQLVPGDIVAIEAGDIVPADGRLLKTVMLDVVQWLICTVVALSVVVAAEIRKAVLRRRTAATAVQSAGARRTGATTL